MIEGPFASWVFKSVTFQVDRIDVVIRRWGGQYEALVGGRSVGTRATYEEAEALAVKKVNG